jgi:hypothetical protein
VTGLYFIGGPYIKAKGPLFMSFMLIDDSQTYMELLLKLISLADAARITARGIYFSGTMDRSFL